MDKKYSDNIELLSLNSISKGLIGECGLRGGYMETHNLDSFVSDQLYKLKSIELCSNTVGQVTTLLMIDPPVKGIESAETVERFQKEESEIFQGLKDRAELLNKTFNEMKNTTCAKIQGAMYAFPRIHLSQKAIQAAKDKNLEPDFLYCYEMLEQTGIMTVPGSGFGQKEDEYHFRITNLVTPTSEMKKTLDRLLEFNEGFHKKYN